MFAGGSAIKVPAKQVQATAICGHILYYILLRHWKASNKINYAKVFKIKDTSQNQPNWIVLCVFGVRVEVYDESCSNNQQAVCCPQVNQNQSNPMLILPTKIRSSNTTQQ